jgi:hypothetical protein
MGIPLDPVFSDKLLKIQLDSRRSSLYKSPTSLHPGVHMPSNLLTRAEAITKIVEMLKDMRLPFATVTPGSEYVSVRLRTAFAAEVNMTFRFAVNFENTGKGAMAYTLGVDMSTGGSIHDLKRAAVVATLMQQAVQAGLMVESAIGEFDIIEKR